MNEIKYKTLILDQDQKLCKVDEEEVNLTKKEYELLLLFLTQPNKIHTREEIMKAIWDKPITSETVNVNINRLRKKLGKYNKNLITRSGFGYGFKTK